MYIGGSQKRPDAPYCRPVHGASGGVVGQVAEGNRKDIREAVEAAHKAAPGSVRRLIFKLATQSVCLQVGKESSPQ